MIDDEWRGHRPGSRKWTRGIVQFAVANLVAASLFSLVTSRLPAEGSRRRPRPGSVCYGRPPIRRPWKIKEVVPGLSRLAVLARPGTTAMLAVKEIEFAARSSKVTVYASSVRGPDELEGAVAAMARERAGALSVVPGLMFNEHRKRLVDLVAKNRLPATYLSRDFLEAGGLMSYAPSFTDQFRRCATYTDKILRGANPGDLPIEGPTKFELVINLRTAKALGLAISPSLLLRADQVVE